jgi:hypothetical protein
VSKVQIKNLTNVLISSEMNRNNIPDNISVNSDTSGRNKIPLSRA